MQCDGKKSGILRAPLKEVDQLLTALSQVFTAVAALVIDSPELSAPDFQLLFQAQGMTIHVVAIGAQHEGCVTPGFVVKGWTMGQNGSEKRLVLLTMILVHQRQKLIHSGGDFNTLIRQLNFEMQVRIVGS